MKTATCPPQPTIVNVELISKDGLKGYQDNYVFASNRLVTAIDGRVSGAYIEWDASKPPPSSTTIYVSRTYRDSGVYCRDCGRRIFREE